MRTETARRTDRLDDAAVEQPQVVHPVAAVVAGHQGAPAGRQRFTQVIIGGSRLWYSEDFGTSWVTLPGGTPPPAGNLDHDAFGQPITVWGRASPGEAVRVRLRGQARRTVAAADGRWAVTLPAALAARRGER